MNTHNEAASQWVWVGDLPQFDHGKNEGFTSRVSPTRDIIIVWGDTVPCPFLLSSYLSLQGENQKILHLFKFLHLMVISV